MMALPKLTPPQVRFAVLRDGERWHDVELTGLSVRPSGELELRHLPALSAPLQLAEITAAPAGIALDADCGLILVDRSARAIERRGLACGEVTRLAAASAPECGAALPSMPAGGAIGSHGWFYVADRESGDVVVIDLPELAPRARFATGLARPDVVTTDGDGLWVLATSSGELSHFAADGTPDRPRTAACRAALAGILAGGIAAGAGDTLYVADPADQSIRHISSNGRLLRAVRLQGRRPGALAVSADLLAAADTASGQIVVLGLPDLEPLGIVAGFGGPVAGLVFAADGGLFVKYGDGADYVAAPPIGWADVGTLRASFLDAGRDGRWLKVRLDVEPSAAESVTLEVATGDRPSGPLALTPAPATDFLVVPNRYLSLRVTVRNSWPKPSPLIRDVVAATEGDSYLDYLPAFYSRDPGEGDFLRRFLELARTQLGGLEDAIAALPRWYDPMTAPAEALPWLAGWLGFEVPAALADGHDPAALRALLAGLWHLAERRGTPAGLREQLRIYAGLDASIVEGWQGQGLLVLDAGSALGFGTTLAASDPEGFVVGQDSVGEARPEASDIWTGDLLGDDAYRFTVRAPAASLPGEAARELARTIIEREKPAHTDCHLCLVEPRLRVGWQARVGIDAIVAGPAPGLTLDAQMGLTAEVQLSEPTEPSGSVGPRYRLGIDARVG